MLNTRPILLIEDDPDIQGLLRLFLEGEGFSVQSAYNGLEALEYLKAGKKASAILLDLMMPVMDGYEFLEEMSSESYQSFRDIPVIVLSAAADIEKAAQVQALEFVRKPIQLDQLLQALQKLQ